jgi:phosphatidylglycerol lysyltransferase
MKSKARDYTSAAFAGLTLLIFGLAVWVLHHSLAQLSLATVLAHMKQTGWLDIAKSAALTACSYGMLTFYDYLALKGARAPLPWRQVAPVSYIAFAIGHSVGLSSISGGSIRYRCYTRLGIGKLQIAVVVGLVSITFALGVGTVLGLSLLGEPRDAARVLHLTIRQVHWLGSVILLCVGAWILLTALRRKPLILRGREMSLPTVRVTLQQILIAAVDLCFASGTLYVLLPDSVTLNYFGFIGLYVLAIYAGVVSNVPGGLGVFESVLILLIPGAKPEGVLGAVLLYRVIYYLVPFVFGLGWLGLREAIQQRANVRRISNALRDAVETFAPQALSGAVFLSGAVLLLSGATPEIGSRMEWISDLVPLGVLEVSHLIGSAIGVVLLILARGLYQRLDGAWWMTLILLAAGVGASLLKGLDYEEALLLSAVLVVLLMSHERFYRRASLLDLRYSRAWIVGIVLVVGTAVWVSIVSYRDVQFGREMWWQFAFDSDAPRVMRAGMLSVLIAAGYVLWLLLSPSRPDAVPPSPADLDRAAAIVEKATDTLPNLALLGDKQIMFHPAGDAFIMYQRSGRSMIALGDPAGNKAHFEELVWRYREFCDENAAWPVFYQVTAEQLPLYLDLGLALAKLGEEARVFLPDFSLDGSHRSSLRNEYRRAGKEGATFKVLSPPEVEAELPQLRRISDEWLASKSAAEKGFSVGRFEPDYLRRFSCGCVMRNGQIVAFTNLWQTYGRDEFSIDLMRYGNEAPRGVMDYLFIELMLWGKREGFRWFNLGMAPLSGLERHPLAPFWHKLGLLVHRYGGNFYNFDGLRRYKEKFGPQWRPRYLASPGGLVLPRVLLDTAALIAGGVKEVVWKS